MSNYKIQGDIADEWWEPNKYQLETIDEFMKAGIELKFFHLNDFKYSQLGTKFIPKLSIMDLVFNEGPKSSEYIKANFSFEK